MPRFLAAALIALLPLAGPAASPAPAATAPAPRTVAILYGTEGRTEADQRYNQTLARYLGRWIDECGVASSEAPDTKAAATLASTTLTALLLRRRRFAASELTVDVEAHLLAVPGGHDAVPFAHPVRGQVHVERVFQAGMEVELQLLVATLHDAELRVALRHVGRTLVHAAELAGLHVEGHVLQPRKLFKRRFP